MMNAFSGKLPPEGDHKHPVVEQRRHGRAVSNLHAAFKPEGYEAFGSVIGNISLGGAWLDTREHSPKVGSEGKLQIRAGDATLYVIAKVVRSTPEGIGVTFIDMGIETYGNLKAYVEQLASESEESSD